MPDPLELGNFNEGMAADITEPMPAPMRIETEVIVDGKYRGPLKAEASGKFKLTVTKRA